MANKKISNDELFSKDLFAGDLKKNAEDLIKLLKAMETDFVNVGKAYQEILKQESGKTVKSIQKITKATKELEDVEADIEKVRRDNLKLQKQLNTLNSDTIQDNEELKVQISEQRKANKQIAKEKLGLVSLYSKESKRLRQLKNDYKDLALQNKENTKEGKALLREIKKQDKALKDLDAQVGDNFRNVGNYENALDGLSKKLAIVAGGAAALAGSLKAVETGLNATNEGTIEAAKAAAQLEAAQAKGSSVFGNLILDIVDFGKAVKNNAVPALMALGSGNFSDIFKRTAKDVKDADDALEAYVDEAGKAVEEQFAFNKASRETQKEIADLTAEIDKQEALAGDSTRSFAAIDAAAEAALDATVKRGQLLLELREGELQLIEDQITRRKEAGIETLSLQDDLLEAELAVVNQRGENAAAVIDLNKTIRENDRDRFEQELDFAIDAFDNLKTINERRINDERRTLEDRRAILNETNRLADKAFKNQEQLVRDITGSQVELSKLVNETDEELIRAQLLALGFNEIVNQRILEIIRDRRTATEDLAEANRDLTDSEREAALLREDIIDQQEALAESTKESFEQLDQEQRDNLKENLRERIDALEENSVERLRLEKELNDLLIEEQKERIENEEKAEQEKLDAIADGLEEAIERREQLLNTAEDIFINQFERRIESIDRAIDDTGERISSLEENAREARVTSEESIAFEIREQAELERERERIRRRQQRTEALFTVLETFNQNDGNLQKTVTDISLLRTLANQLAGSAFEGVDDTGGSGGLDKKGGSLWMLHPNEQVWSKKDRESVGFKSRQEIIDLVQSAESDLNYINKSDLDQLRNKAASDPSNQIVKGLKNIEKAVSDKEENRLLLDSVRNTIIQINRTGRKVVRTHSKLK